MSDKIKASHLSRKAVLYVRQSTRGQLIRNEESRRLQYQMEKRLKAFGWANVEILDEDLGKSASHPEQRSGFDVVHGSPRCSTATACWKAARPARNRE